MRRSIYEEGPVARDAFGVRLSVEQINQIEYYLERAASGAWSRSFFKTLHEGGRNKLREAMQRGAREDIERLGPEVQVIEHILKVAFRGNQPTKAKPDPKHIEYIRYEEQKERDKLPKKDYGHPNRWVVPYWKEGDPNPAFEMLRILAIGVMNHVPSLYDIAFNPYEEGKMELLFEIDGRQYARVEIVVDEEDNLVYRAHPSTGIDTTYTELDDAIEAFIPVEVGDEVEEAISTAGEFDWLDPELRADIVPLSSDPAIMTLQQRLRREILELYEAEQERQPPFILAPIRRRLARAHEALVEARGSSRYHY